MRDVSSLVSCGYAFRSGMAVQLGRHPRSSNASGTGTLFAILRFGDPDALALYSSQVSSHQAPLSIMNSPNSANALALVAEICIEEEVPDDVTEQWNFTDLCG